MALDNLILSKSNYLIAIALFFSSFFIYGFNLQGQPWHGDEITYLGWGGNYFNLLGKGDFNNPCLDSLDSCHLLFHIPAFGLTYSTIRNILIGLPMYLTHQNNGNFYNWSCYWDCYNSHNGPTVNEMTAGRLLSPLFGSLAVVLLFFIGKMLFNKTVGTVASIFFLFYDLWLWYSRSIMVEVHYIFFALLSILLLLYSFRIKKRGTVYFVSSAILLGFALNSKMLAIAFSGLFLGIIIIKCLSSNEPRKDRLNPVAKTIVVAASFFSISLLGFFLAEPGFYDDPINEIKHVKADMDNYNRDVWYIGYPSINNIQVKSTISVFHFIVFPSFIEQKILNPSLDLHGNFGWTYPPTYSSVPMTLFFFVGIGSVIYHVIKYKNWLSSELLLVIWFASTFLLTIVIVRDFSLERYLLPLETSVLVIASYGAWHFVKGVTNNKAKILFVSFVLFVHSMTSLSYWQKIYFSPGTMWVNPLHYGTLQQSLDNPITFDMNLLFVGSLVLLALFALKNRMASGVLKPQKGH